MQLLYVVRSFLLFGATTSNDLCSSNGYKAIERSSNASYAMGTTLGVVLYWPGFYPAVVKRGETGSGRTAASGAIDSLLFLLTNCLAAEVSLGT